MSMTARIWASGRGWTVREMICTAGPGDLPFEERHESVCIAAVLRGSFRYRTAQGAGTLAPGALLLGNAGAAFECGHDHEAGDRCVSFAFAPAFFDTVLEGVPGARRHDFSAPLLPPSEALLPLVARAEAARGDALALEETGLRLAGAVARVLEATPRAAPAPRRRDERRIAEALRRIETHIVSASEAPLALGDLARGVAMSPYHFLRVFRAVVGMTPHRFVLAERLRRAAVRLRQSDDAVAAIAFDAGFNDLSTFNRRFRRIMGTAPSVFRSGGR